MRDWHGVMYRDTWAWPCEPKISIINDPIAIQGGSSWNRAAKFNHIMFDVNSMEASAARIAETIVQQPAEHAVVVMAHNGPAGLGQQQHDICGRDWLEKAGKHCLAIANCIQVQSLAVEA